MSSKKQQQQQQQIERKPFCKVCQDAGKTQEEYTSHYTRASPESNSIVICPTLLALECRYCFKNGHTVKYCTVLAANNKMKQKVEKATAFTSTKEAQQVKKMETKQKPINKFAALDSDSDEEEDDEKSQQKLSMSVSLPAKEEFPALPSKLVKAHVATVSVVSSSYASMASKPAMMSSIKKAVPTTTTASTWVEEFDTNTDDEAEAYELAIEVARQQIKEEKMKKVSSYTFGSKKASEMDWAMAEESDDEDW
jgi:hypothetical protein